MVAAWTELDLATRAACRWNDGLEGIGAPLGCDAERLDAVIAQGEAFLRHVIDDGRIRYLVGLAWRHKGELVAAERALEDAVRLAPDRAEAWFDLGELRARRQDWKGAREAFARVTELIPEGPRAWPGWLQRAQVAAHEHDPDALETHLRQALRHGFTFAVVVGNPAWQGFFQDRDLRPVLERLVKVYADPEIADQLLGSGER